MIGLKYIGKCTCDECGTGYSVSGPLNVFKNKGSEEIVVLCDECEEQMESEDSEGDL